MGYHSQQYPGDCTGWNSRPTWNGCSRSIAGYQIQQRVSSGCRHLLVSLTIAGAASLFTAPAGFGGPGARDAAGARQEASNRKDEKAPQQFSVTITGFYPHANAEVVADSVAAPIESNVRQLPGLERRRSWCASDGSYRLDLRLALGAGEAAVLQDVRNALELVRPVLPVDVQKAGLGIKRTPASPAVLVTIQATDNLRNSLVLADYLGKVVQPRLNQLRGVSQLSVFGAPDFRQRLHIDFDKMHARGVRFVELAGAIESQKSAGMPVTLQSAAKLEDSIVKTTPQGQSVQVKDIARVEMGADWPLASLGARPVIALAVHPTPGASAKELADGVRKEVVDLGRAAPEGITIGLAIDFSRDCQPGSRNRLLIIDCQFPDSSSSEQLKRRLQKCELTAAGMVGVTATFASAKHLTDPNSRNASMLVRYAPEGDHDVAREKLAAALVDKLRATDPDLTFHVRDWTTTGPRHPVSLALLDEGEFGHAALGTWADACLAYLKTKEPMLSDAFSSFPLPSAAVRIDITRAKLAALGIELNEIQAALSLVLGNDAEEYRGKVRELKDLKILNRKGMEIPLSALIAVRDVLSPSVIQRIDGFAATLLYANLRAGSKRPDLEKLAERVAAGAKLPTGFRLVVIEE